MENRFDGMTYDEALAAFESEPRVRVLVDQGAADGFAAGTPEPAAVFEFDRWPIPEAVATRFVLGDDGRLTEERTTLSAASSGTSGSSTYSSDPDALPATFHDVDSDDQGDDQSDATDDRSTTTDDETDDEGDDDEPGIWEADVEWDWRPMPDGTGVGFITEPFATDRFIAGSGSADLWIAADADDADVEVTITEVRDDGTEIYVQSGWLRLSHRTLADDSTELRPVHTHAEADVAPLDDEPVLARVEVFPFAHAFRAGSRLRLTVDAPGNNRRPVGLPHDRGRRHGGHRRSRRPRTRRRSCSPWSPGRH